jgi:hypothetical protein
MGYEVGKTLHIKWKQSPLLMIHPSSRPIDLLASNVNTLADLGLLIKHGKRCF